jgi:hypothetical protein
MLKFSNSFWLNLIFFCRAAARDAFVISDPLVGVSDPTDFHCKPAVAEVRVCRCSSSIISLSVEHQML